MCVLLKALSSGIKNAAVVFEFHCHKYTALAMQSESVLELQDLSKKYSESVSQKLPLGCREMMQVP